MGKHRFPHPLLGTDKKAAIWLAIATGTLAIAVPIALSIYWAWKHNLDNQIEFTASIAREVLRRSEAGVREIDAIHTTLANAGASSEPCSAENIRLMERLNIRSRQTQSIAYIQDNVLRCSAYGVEHIELPAPTFTTPLGTRVWTEHEFPQLPGTRFLILAPKGTGHAALLLPQNFLDVFTDDPHISIGLYSLSAQQIIANRGAFEPQWLQRLGTARQVQFIDNDHFVVVHRSDRFEFASYAVQPVANVHEGLFRTARVLVPIGILAGVLLALAVFHLARQQFSLPATIRMAIRRREFVLYYRPVVALQTGLWVGAEALIRWHRPTGETIPPDGFIRAAEENGLIQDLTFLVMEMVGHDAGQIFKERPDFHLAINLSAADLESPATIQGLAKLLRDTGARPGSLLVEATERGFMKADVASTILHEIRHMGIGVAIDDFGTGYSSLSYLETFELDFLKIDKSFVNTVGRDAATSQVVPHIIEMAKSLKLTMIAEGVETEAQAQYLRQHGVQLAQGWLFARPMPLAELVKKLAAPPKRAD